ncbi:MAG: peptidylprolyl isomerase, partial [Proteobacteria bacterium]|nr:peptidylprolyl isomerase [Pseudomonadota bacterium]
RVLLSAILLAALGATSTVQAQSSLRQKSAAPAPRGITDIMRAGPQASEPPAAAAPLPTPAPTTTPSGQRVAEYIVALVNSEPVTNTEVLSRVQRALRQGGPEVERVPRAELNRMALERIIVEKAQLQQAKEIGIKIDDLAVDQAEEGVARQNQMTVADLGRRLAQEGISRDAYRNELRTQITLARLREREVEPKVKVSDLEVDQFLRDQGSAAAKSPPNVNIAHVLVAVPDGASDAKVAELEQKAQGIAQRARGGEDFNALARDLSDAPDRLNGGALGLRSAERYPPLFIEATQNLQVGGIAGPVRSGAGFHVLKVLAKSQPGEVGGTVTQTKVRHILLRVDDKRSTTQAAKELAEFKKRIDAGTATFAGLARDNSQDGSAKDGGELGWSRPGMFVPEFEEAMDRLQPGQVS